jgi:outer membrane protein assembly factor BamB
MNKKAPLVFVVLLLLLLSSSLVLSEGEQASDSGQFHGDERHNGFIASVGPTSALLAWKIEQKCDGMIASSGRLLAVDVYVSTDYYRTVDYAHICVLNETSGVKLGDIQEGKGLLTRYSAIGAGNIFSIIWVEDYYGAPWSYSIFVTNLFSLEVKWSKEFESLGYWGANCYSIQIPYNKLLLTYSKGRLFEAYTYKSDSKSNGTIRAYIASSGTIAWEVKFEGYTISTIPTVADDVVVIGFLNNPKITALSTDNGKILWSFTMDSPVSSSPAYSSNYFYFDSTNGVVYAVSKDGKELWHTNLGSGIETTPAVAFGRVFVGADDGNLYALDATSGKMLWKYSTGGPITASPVVSVNEIVYVGSTDGKIYALNAKNGELVWSDNTGASIEVTPVLDNGMLFVASSDGTIRAYGKPSFASVVPGWDLPSPPRNLTAIGGVGYVLLTWKPPSSTGAPQNYSGSVVYNVFRGTLSGQEKFFVQVNGTSYTDSSVEPGITYYYVVTAVNPAGSSEFSNEASASALVVTPPSAVSDLTVAIVGDSIRLSWSPPSSTGGLPITQYIIYRGIDPSSLSVYATILGNVTSFADTNFDSGKTYYYKVQAVNAQGKGDLSSIITVVAPEKSSWINWILNPSNLVPAVVTTLLGAILTELVHLVFSRSHKSKE